MRNKSYNKEFQDIQNKLKNLAEGNADRQVLIRQINTLQIEKEKLINQAEALAKQLTVVDLDKASKLAKAAYDKFQIGDIKGAIAVLEAKVTRQRFKRYSTSQSKSR